MLALVGRPSLHGNDACMVFLLLGHFGEIAGKKSVRPLFLLFEFFCLVGILGMGFGVLSFGICGLGGLGILGPTLLPAPHLGVEVLNVGGWLTHGDVALEARVDFLAVVEHQLIPAMGVNGLDFGTRICHLSGLQLHRTHLMLVMLVSVL